MVIIQVKPDEKEKAFRILSENGRFIGLPDNKFSIIENVDATIKKLEAAGIKPKITN